MSIRPRFLLLPLLLAATGLAGQSALLHDAALTGWHVIVDGRGKVPVTDQDHFVWEDSVLHVLPTAKAGSQ
ncbi:hypothetical protein [Neolewinella litorea]|uniref:Uncharacterized protein n=1 Tax=Neolewinella litorea TaxID=2562452 RepID=A0A4V3XKC9_9BACT|nr:hypothetical protein [Neolewinella litorea]THH36483.1 hypothetical protein E4021_14545 [Neolewinella litorea]